MSPSHLVYLLSLHHVGTHDAASEAAESINLTCA